MYPRDTHECRRTSEEGQYIYKNGNDLTPIHIEVMKNSW